MHMFGHHDVSGDVAPVPTANPFELMLENISRCGRIEKGHAAITAESDEVYATLMLVAGWLGSHFKGILVPKPYPTLSPKAREGWGNPIWEFNPKAGPAVISHPLAKSARRVGQPQCGNSI